MFTAEIAASPSASPLTPEWRWSARVPADGGGGWITARVSAPSAFARSEGIAWICGEGRLDDRDAAVPDGTSDLERLLHAYVASGLEGMTRLNGSYGVVVWDERTHSLHAVRDPLGVSPLYYRLRNGMIAVGDRTERLSPEGELDRHFISAFIATGESPPGHTVWRHVEVVPTGTVLTWHRSRLTRYSYWSAEAFMQSARVTLDPEAPSRFRALVKNAVSRQLDDECRTWAHLSGGHDSSTVVSTAAALGRAEGAKRLGGTVTLVDSIGSGDESFYVDAVLRAYPLRNERIRDMWPWQDDGLPPPVTSDPTRDFPFYARDRECSGRMRSYGATAVLSGIGPDLYLPFTDLRASDMLWSGQVGAGVRFMFDWAVAQDVSFWATLRKNACAPLVPRKLRSWYHGRRIFAPEWLRPEFAREHGFAEHLVRRHVHLARPGHLLASLVADRLQGVASSLQGWMAGEGVEVRHPLMYRPLVEEALQLAHSEFADAAPKRVLRLAMEGIVPQPVLGRRSKGSLMLPRACWAFRRERARLEEVLRRSVLADLGVIEPALVLETIDRAASGRIGDDALHVYCALSMETWLLTRADRYPPPRSPKQREQEEEYV